MLRFREVITERRYLRRPSQEPNTRRVKLPPHSDTTLTTVDIR